MSLMVDTCKKNRCQALLPWVVWGLGCLFYFYEFLLQVSPGVMHSQLNQAFNLTAQGFGLLGGVYFYSYSGMQIPAGILLDRLGPHKLLTLATLMCALSTLAFSLTTSFNTAMVARFCIGFGSAFAVVGTMKLAANWFKPERFGLLTGIMVAVGMTGAIGGEKPLALLVERCGWRDSMLYLGFAGLVLAALLYFFAKDRPFADSVELTERQSLAEAIAEVLHSLRRVLKNGQLWLVACYGGLVFMATPVFCGLWGVPFLVSKYHVSTVDAATLTSMIFVGWILGSPSWGFISDKIRRRKPPMILGAVGALIFLSLVIYFPITSYQLVAVNLFFFGLCSAGFLPAFSIAKEISCNQNCATALSFMNMMNMIGVAISQPLIGIILDNLWQRDNTLVVIDRLYTTNQYTQAISVLPCCLLLSLLLLPFIKETYCIDSTH